MMVIKVITKDTMIMMISDPVCLCVSGFDVDETVFRYGCLTDAERNGVSVDIEMVILNESFMREPP